MSGVSKKRWLAIILVAFLAVTAWNYPLSYRIGVEGKILNKKIPLYAKACGFLYRDWMYKDIVREIEGNERDDLKKVLNILSWVNKNIRYNSPAVSKIVDDHPLNIIIRQYGQKDQIEDIFTILCSYAGFKAGRKVCRDRSSGRSMVLSFVRVKDRWLIFDAVRNKYFINKNGEIGSIEDYYSGNMVMSKEDKEFYGAFLDDSKRVAPESFIRVDEQMPFRRVQAQIRKLFIKEKEAYPPIQ